MKIVGVAGLPRSGKDTLAELLMERGWFGLSFGDVVRGFARERHADRPDPISVANMTETSNWLRETRGADVILQEALHQYEAASKLKDYEGLVLYSVRAPVEVDWILAHGGELVWVDASDEVRHQRNLLSLREGEAVIDLEEFKRQEALQWRPQPGIPAEVQMDLEYVKNKATKVIDNNDSDLAAFQKAAIYALGL
jgi:dephospho-CoA kinase